MKSNTLKVGDPVRVHGFANDGGGMLLVGLDGMGGVVQEIKNGLVRVSFASFIRDAWFYESQVERRKL